METEQENGKILLNIIESFAFTRAIELLQKDHSFTQDELDKALILTCQHGHKFLIQALVRSGANVHCKDTHGNTTLMICTQNGFTDVVRFLIGKKVDVNATNSAGDTALLLSVCPSGFTDITKLLLEQSGIQVYHQNKDGYTALMKAVEVKDVDTVKILIDDSAKLKIHGRSGKVQTPRSWRKLMKTVNCKHETTRNIADRQGLGNVFQLLRTHRNRQNNKIFNTSLEPLVGAMKTNDAKSFSVLLDCQFAYMSDMNCFDNMLKSMFQQCQKNTTKCFNDGEVTIIKRLLECGADVNSTWYDLSNQFAVVEIDDCELNEFIDKQYKERTNPLKTAVKLGDRELVKLLLKYQAKVNSDYKFLNSALHCALQHGHTDCAKLLIQHGANMNIKYALVSAVNNQIPKYMDFLCENYKDEIVIVLQKSASELCALVRSAVRGGNLEIITHIFELGVDCSDVNIPLAESQNGEIARFLIERGADVNAIKEGFHANVTPLLDVLITRRYDLPTMEVIQVLLENGASTNDRDCSQQTPLIIAACRNGSIPLLQLLLDHGADFSNKDSYGNTALIGAILTDCSECASFLIKFAKDRMDVLNSQNNVGLTALMYAAGNDNLDLVRELLREGVDVNIKDADGNTALSHALSQACMSDEELLLALLSAGSDINWQNNNGLSPLMFAAKNCLQDAVSLLLESGADVNAVSEKDDKKTALSFIPDNAFLAIDAIFCMEYLLDKGANASYLNACFLPKLILNGGDILIPKLIRCGIGPADFELNEVYPRFSGMDKLSRVSPLSLAILIGNITLAQYFVGNVYLTKSDVSSLMSNNNLRDYLDWNKQQDCADFLASISSQPLSLFNLSLVAVSSAVGTSPGRESRINILPIPEKIKHKLLFKSEDVELIPSDNLTTDSDSLAEMRALHLRLFEDYYLQTRIYSHSDDDDDFDDDSELSSRSYSHSDFGFDYNLELESYSYWSDSD